MDNVNGDKEPYRLTITIDENGIPNLESGGGADLFTLIVMADVARHMLMSQYIQIAAAAQQRQDQFKPKLLVPSKGL